MNEPADVSGPGGLLRAAHRRAVVVYAALLGSVAVYAAIVEILSRGRWLRAGAEGFQVMRLAFYAVAVSMVFLTHLVRGLMLRGPGGQTPEVVAQRLSTATIAAGALAESPAILGLVLFMLDPRLYSDFYFLLLISLYLLLRHFPRLGQWQSTAQRLTQTG